ncbi:hypothetical protein [Acidipila rosea]|uniref:Uncharacterized protein n=1 Tax=Acidipila rosea TaxID=768535 RepID=A0A4R1L9C4_9BACT|nr:hypothetical protein [Acidipila rosea]TCK73937.1 hypothetical protein C7378_1557 [Acidipila rosea]
MILTRTPLRISALLCAGPQAAAAHDDGGRVTEMSFDYDGSAVLLRNEG